MRSTTNTEKLKAYSKCILLFLIFTLIVRPSTAQTNLRFDIFTQGHGLPNNQIQCIFQDSKGWMWIGTSQGLAKFDGYGFVNYLDNPNDENSINGSLIRVIEEDSKGNLLIGTEIGGLNIFHRETEIFSHPLKSIPEYSTQDISVNDIIIDNNGTSWVATDFNIFSIDTLGNIDPLDYVSNDPSIKLEGNYVRNLKFDPNGILWIGTNNGIYIYNPQNKQLSHFDLPLSENQNKEIWELYIDEEGFLWIGTYAAGIYIVDPKEQKIIKNILFSSIPRAETVRAISKGYFGEYWIGTRGGLIRYSKTTGITGIFRNSLQEPESISNNSVLSIYNDEKGETWIGTRGGLNLLAKSKQVFQNFTALPGNSNYLNSSIIYAFWIDEEGKIWIGTEDGGINIYNPQTKTYEYITAGSGPRDLNINCIKSFLPDNDKLWVATFMGGLNLIDLNTRRVKYFQHNSRDGGSLSDNRVWDLCADNNNQIWIATSRGVDRYDRATNTFIHYPQINGNERVSWIECDSEGTLWIGSIDEIIIFNPEQKTINRFYEYTRGFFEDSRNRTWVTTNDKGIALYSKNSGAIKYYTEENGLPNKQALCMLEDVNNNLWISTSNGLSKFNPSKGEFQNFTAKDGLGNNQFCYGAAAETTSGELLFGSVSGFNLFNPSEILPPDDQVRLVFTDLKIFSKSVKIESGKDAVLQKSISETNHLTLNYKQNVFALEFAALNFVNSEKNLYAYKLENFNRDWIGPGHERIVHYTNLNPGDYTLKVKPVFNNKTENHIELSLDITILPPFWKTSWFIGLIIFMIMGMVYVLIRFIINREKIKNQLSIERVNARKLHELDMMKLKFFTNISHEIRTPLTLILGPLEKMLQGKQSEHETQENLKLMHRNTLNLDRLITQLLDFRKLETGNLKLKLTEGDIISFVRNIVTAFEKYAEEKEIKLTFTSLKKRLFVSFDPDKIEKILNNLLSNALKYTQTGDSIAVNLSLIFDENDESFSENETENQFIEISIKDTGKGIPQKNIDKIFMRFFQSSEGEQDAGVGIGLALVKDLVKLHKGNIFVTSKLGKGTKFTIRIPIIEIPETQVEHDIISNPNGREHIDLIAEEALSENPGTSVMLIVEDNADVRQFIRSNFNSFYKIFEANNGEEGWKMAKELIPDIILSDIIMPNMDGYNLCKKIKNDERTSHIPVLLLTAMHSKENELKGLSTGANDYITKPFDISVLHAKVNNLLSIRDSLKERYTSTVVLEPTNVLLSSPEERFLKKAMDVVEENISDYDLDIESFALKVGVSRMQLYRKLHALTNMTVKEFIRHIRLKRATQLLVQKKMTISEIAYNVGFKDLSHFRKCFKREYGMSAKEYIENHSENKE